MQIKDLEETLGGVLLERSPRQVALTKFGEEAAERVRDILRLVDELGDFARASRDRLVGRLRIGMIPTIAPYLLPKVIANLTRMHPELDIHVRETLTPKLIEELVPKLASIGDIQRILRQLLRERVSIRDLTTILEAVADAAALTKDPDAITESVRAAIGRAICRPYQTEKGEMPAISLTPALEERLLSSIVRTEQGAVLALDPTQAQRLASRIAEVFAAAVAQPVLLCSPALRPHLWRLFARVLPHLGVLSHNEIPPQMQVAAIATLD